MTKTHFKLFFLTLLLLTLIPSVMAQENLVLPYKSDDGLWFYFAVQKDQFTIPLRNNSFVDRPQLLIYVAGPKLSQPQPISIQIVFYKLETVQINGTSIKSRRVFDTLNVSMIVSDDFTQTTVQLPKFQNETYMGITYRDLKLIFRYKVNPLFLQTSEELFIKRLIGIAFLAIAVIIIALISMKIARWLLEKIHYIPGDPFLILVVTGILGFMAYSYIQNLQYLDPAMYVSIGAFIANNYNILLLASAFIITFVGALFIFRQYPNVILLLRFIWDQTPTPESKEFRLKTYVLHGIEKENKFIKLPESLIEFLFFILGVKQVIRYPEENWFISDTNNNYKKIYVVDQEFDPEILKLKIELNWKYILVLLISLVLIATMGLLTIIGVVILIYILYMTRDRVKEKKIKKGEKEEIVQEHIPGIKLISIKNREIKLKLAPIHTKRLFEAFYDLLEKKALLDFNREILLKLNKALTEKDLAKLEAILTVADEYLGGMEKTLLEKEEKDNE